MKWAISTPLLVYQRGVKSAFFCPTQKYFSNKNVFNLKQKAWLAFLGVLGVADSESDVLWPLWRHLQGRLKVKCRKCPKNFFKNQCYMFLRSLIPNLMSFDLYDVIFKVIWRSNVEKALKKYLKISFICFWGRWFRIWCPLTSMTSSSRSFEGQM